MKTAKDILNENGNSNKEKNNKKNNNKKGSSLIFPPLVEPMVSLFENFYSKEPIREMKLSRFLLTHKFKEEVEFYRACTDEMLREKIKGNL